MSVTLAVVALSAGAGALAMLLGRRIDSAVGEWGDDSRLVASVRDKGRHAGGDTMVVIGLFGVAGMFTLAGAMLDMVNAGTGLARLDVAVAEWGSRSATPIATGVLTAITHLGSTIGVLLIGIGIGWWDFHRRHTFDAAWFLGTVYAGHTVISNVVKALVGRDRPPVDHLVETASSSFPSTHAGTAAAMWLATALVVGRTRTRGVRLALTSLAGATAVAVATSRALLGVHWVTDVVAGLAIGAAWFLLVATVFGGRRLRYGRPVERADVEDREQTQ